MGDPLFIFGAVAVGMFGNPALGSVLALAHYASVLLVGLTFRFYKAREEPRSQTAESGTRGIHGRAYDALLRGRADDGRRLGKVLNSAISESVSTLFMIMSFMVLFAVLIRVLQVTGVAMVLTMPLSALYNLLGMSPHLVNATLQGFFEIDLGSAAAAKAHAPLVQQLTVVSAIIAWSGLSVHGQVASVLADTDISLKPYFVARALHAAYAAVLTVAFFPLGKTWLSGVRLPTFAAGDFRVAAPPGAAVAVGVHLALLMAAGSLAILTAGATVLAVAHRLRRGWFGFR